MGHFAHLRPGCHVGEGAHIGNFVETKKSADGHRREGKSPDLSGRCADWQRLNIGAGTITCNYDGVNKHETLIGDGVFIGSDSALVAPIVIGDGAYVAAGSVVTEMCLRMRWRWDGRGR